MKNLVDFLQESYLAEMVDGIWKYRQKLAMKFVK